MYHQVNIQEPKDPMERIKQKALRVIAQHGRLYWCSSKICGCMGCANTSMTREEYDQAITMPAVVYALNMRREVETAYSDRNIGKWAL